MAFADFTFAFERTEAGWIWFHGYSFARTRARSSWSASGEVARARLRRPGRRRVPGRAERCSPGTSTATPWRAARTPPAEPLGHVPDGAQRALARRERGAAGGLRPYGALLHRLGNADGAAGRRRARPRGRGLPPAELPAALQRYQDARLPVGARPAADAERSAGWFENVERRIRLDPVDFGYALRMRGSPLEDGVQSGTPRSGTGCTG